MALEYKMKQGKGEQSFAKRTHWSQQTCFSNNTRDMDTWTAPDGQHGNQMDYTLCNQGWRNSVQLAKTRPKADCGSDHDFLIAKFRLKLKKVRKITRPFRYDLNQIPYDYMVEVINRFKGLDLIDRVPEKLWTEVHNIIQEAEMKNVLKKKKCKKAKWLFEEALQIAEKKKRSERQKSKRKIYP